MIETGLIAARFLHLTAAMALFGLALFPLYCRCRGDRSAALGRWLRPSLRGAAWLALLSGLGWSWLTIVNMAGSVSAAVEPDAVRSVLTETSFGPVWVVRLGLVVCLLALLRGGSDVRCYSCWPIVLVTGLLLLGVAFVGHTQTNEGIPRIIHVTADGIHLLAAGAWLGGLMMLGRVLMTACRSPSQDNTGDAAAALVGFSGVGYSLVAALMGSGLINAWFLIGSATELAQTPYGQLLLIKLCLFAAMLALAAVNRFRLVPALVRTHESGAPSASALRKLRRSVAGEQMLGLAVVLIVGYLGTMQPAIVLSK